MTKGKIPLGRLALREEVGFWRAYYALPHTMENALFLGSIRMAIIVENPEFKQRFMELMQDSVTFLLAQGGTKGVTWPDPPRPAPEHERGSKK